MKVHLDQHLFPRPREYGEREDKTNVRAREQEGVL